MKDRTRSGGLLARMSIEYKLPAIIGGLLLVAIVALSAAAYVEVKRTSVRLASERLSSVATQFREILRQQSSQIRATAAAAALSPTVIAFAKSRDPKLRDRALAELGSQRQQVIATELRDASGAVLLSTSSDRLALAGLAVNDVLPSTEPGDSAVLGRFRLLRDTLVYAVAAPVPGVENTYLVRWRRFANSQRSREQMNRLIGTDASLFVGNADGSQWSNLERPVAGPPITSVTLGERRSYLRDGEQRFGAAAAIPGTPWLVAVDFPRRNVMVPVDSFVRRMALIAALALALGLLAAWVMSRRITVPLRDLTLATGEIAAGQQSHPPTLSRSDELGRLSRAFAAMAMEVEQAREGLEHKVAARTRELNDALTQLRDANDALVQRERLAMLGQLSSGVGHELRNPLGVMTNAVYYLKTVLATAPKSVHEYLDIIQQQVTLSEKIVGDLLDFARSKPPQRKPTPIPEATDAQLARLGHREGVRIETDFPATLPPVLVDPTQLGQIILNLLTNATQAIEGQGRIRVHAHQNGNGNDLQYEVSDTGPGVPPENVEKIFEPLFTTKARGIGLGLSVSRTLARANGGDLTVTSTPGRGATFRLTLPIAAQVGERS